MPVVLHKVRAGKFDDATGRDFNGHVSGVGSFLTEFINAIFGAFISSVTPVNLVVLSFFEAIFFPVPPDTLLIPLVLMRPAAGLWYAVLASSASVLGAMVGYWIGLKGGKPFLRRFVDDKKFDQVEALFQRYEVWAIAIAGFTPIPYKVFALSAGLFDVRLGRFVLVSIVSRFARFGLEAALLMAYGEAMAEFIQAQFGWLTLVLMVAVVVMYAVYRFLVKRKPAHR